MASAPGLPALAGTVERVADRELTLRTDEPAPGFALLGVYTWDNRVHTSLSLYLFGDQASKIVARDDAAWQAWMARLFRSAES